ncbi:uncharacterized protein LOC108600443 [Drosophila busckii]|uniref:uncharacterized protein LOC108600443 n=1 Tax=Drosophila busckii TaxID=30019 RepID=UPI00083F2917|nr:uncharacterized protein LOC108600443 [Drosophila busckii]
MQFALQFCLSLLLVALSQQTARLSCNRDGFCVCEGHQVGDTVANCKDCNSYFKCELNSIKQEWCPMQHIYDINVAACVPGQCPRIDGECANPHPIPGPIPPSNCSNPAVQCRFHGQILPHADHCRFFWTCVENCPVMGFCELGMWFDRQNFVCDFPQNVRNCPANRD